MTNHQRIGLAYALGANLIWGFFPLFYKQFEGVDVWVVIAHRVFWAAPFLGFMITLLGLWPSVWRTIIDRKVMRYLWASTLMMAISWALYIWAVHQDRILETALGYYLTPMMNVIVGLVMFKERLRPWQWAAVMLAFTGVLTNILLSDQAPWIGLILGGAFAIYSGIRKLVPVDSLVGVFIEAILTVPIALVIMFYLGWDRNWDWPLKDLTFLVASGLVTVVPIVFYVAASRRLTLGTLGTLFYMAPSFAFFVGVFLFNEPFGWTEAIMFCAIWGGVLIFIWDGWRFADATRKSP